MNKITDEQFQKILLLDKIFGSISVEHLKEFAESEQITARLKGTESNPQLLLTLINERDILTIDNAHLRNDITTLRGDIMSLKTDFQMLLIALNKTVFSYSQDMTSLKQKHNVY